MNNHQGCCDIFEMVPVSHGKSPVKLSNRHAIIINSFHGNRLLRELFMENYDLKYLELNGVLHPVSSTRQLFKFCAVINDFFTFSRNDPRDKEVILRDFGFNEYLEGDLVRECKRCHIAVDAGDLNAPKREPWLTLSQGNCSITILNIHDC